MEHQDISILTTEHKQEIEMLKTSEQINILSTPQQLSSPRFCAFSNLESNVLESEQRSKSATKLSGLIVLYLIFMTVEIIGGMKANSLAVLTDALHLLSDVASVSISLFTIWASSWKPTSRQSFGFDRLEVLGALTSVLLIWLISGILIYEAINRILHEMAMVNGKIMFAVAAFGFLINLIMITWLGHNHIHHGHACLHEDHDHEKEAECAATAEESTGLVSSSLKESNTLNINLQGPYLHAMADLIQSIGVMIAGGIIWAKPNWLAVDLICTLIFSVFVLSTTISMLRDIFGILTERTPSEIDPVMLEKGLRCIEGVNAVLDLHVWSITTGKIVLVCHIVAEPGVKSNEILHKIRDYCEKTYRIHHVTIQVEQE
ncbi:metal tolerance protein B isoform X2 [Malania oleifera]|nr:metal tolerance protein B isoform X2 [Malania oleifera]